MYRGATSACLDGVLETAHFTHVLALLVARGFLPRLLGLIGRRGLAADDGLLLPRCNSVHTCFMRFPIDVVYLDADWRVTSCATNLKPWRASRGGRIAAHVLELQAGAVQRLGIEPGARLVLYPHRPVTSRPRRQRGSALVEFTVVGPIVAVIGLSILQYGMLFFARNQINHATFMAARAGAIGNADPSLVRAAYMQALVPLYGEGRTPAELAASLDKAYDDLAGSVRIEVLNPTRESFADWNDPALQELLRTGSRRVIPNAGQAFKDNTIGSSSGQTIQDANLLKLRITHGYQPKIPLVDRIYKLYLGWMDRRDDAFHTRLVQAGRIPVVTHLTMHMQSDAIEPDDPVSNPGPGNGGDPVDPGTPPGPDDPPPDCPTAGCGTEEPPDPPACDPATDPGGCLPPGCEPGQPCDPACGVTMCCAPSGEGT